MTADRLHHRIPNTFANVMRPVMAWFDVAELFD
jgi:hypothetical protein